MQKNYIKKLIEFIALKEHKNKNAQFLNSLTTFLSKLLDIDYILISKYSIDNPDFATMVVLQTKTGVLPNTTYKLKGTPCQNVINKDLCSYTSNIQSLFPEDVILIEMKAESYLGIPLFSVTDQPIGLVSFLNCKPFENIKELEIVLQIVSIKVSQVLEKKLLEASLESQLKTLQLVQNKAFENELKFKIITNNSADGIALTKLDGSYLYVNPAFCKMVGYSEKELLKLKTQDLFPKYDSKLNSINCTNTSDNKPIQVIFETKKGNLITTEIIRTKTILNGEEVNLCSIRNITERIVLDTKIKIEKENYQQLFEENPVALLEDNFTETYNLFQNLKNKGVKNIETYFSKNPDILHTCFSNLKIVDVNNATIKLFNATSKKHLLTNIDKILANYTLLNYRKILIDLYQGETEIINQITLKNLQKKEIIGNVKINIFKNKLNSEVKTIISIIDITEKINVEKELISSEEKYRSIVENTSEWIWETDSKGVFKYSNSVVEKITGFSPDELNGKDVYHFLSDSVKPFAKKMFKKEVSDKAGWKNLIVKIRGKSGNKLILESFANPIFCKNGSFIGFQGVNRDITKQKEAEKALKKSELKYRNIVENTSEWFWEIDINGNFTYSNDIAERITGYKINELIGQNTFMFIEEHELLKKTLNENIKKNIGWKIFEIEFKHKNGNYYYLESSAIPLYDEEKNLIGYRGVNRDITERKEAEKEHKKLSTAVEQSANAIIITDPGGNIEYTNPKFTEHTGYTSAEVLGKNPRILNSGKHPKEFFTELWNTISAGEIWKGTLQNKNKNGKLFWEQTSITPIKNKDGKIINYLSVKENITVIRESERNLLNAQKIAQIGTYFLDLKSNLFTSSYIFDKISGFKPKDTKTFAVWRTVIHPEDSKDNQRVLDNCIENGVKFNREYRIFTKDTKKLKWIHGLGEITYDNGEPISFSGTIQDITERKNAEIKIKKQNEILKIAKEKAEESDKLKTEFLNNMSHEIRTPMNGILGFTELLSDTNLSSDRRSQYIKIIQNSGNQLLQVIDDILEISRLETKQVTTQENKVCLNNLLLQLFSIFNLKAKESKIPLYFYKGLTDSQSTIITDQGKLLKILSNLLENAFKFTNVGHVSIGYELKNKQIEIYVSDTGIGIAKEKQSNIFERFAQEEKELSQKFGGLGLGLSIAKENSILLGGTIRIESEKGVGSKFIVTIPYNPVNTNNEISTFENETSPIMKSILIAEDEEVNYLFLEMLLVDSFNLNYKILHAKNGLEAVDICKNNTDIGLVLMDIKMPKMNGYEATSLIKEFNSEIPIVAQTAYSTQEDKEKAHAAGCCDFLSKPITRKSLEPIISKYLKI